MAVPCDPSTLKDETGGFATLLHYKKKGIFMATGERALCSHYFQTIVKKANTMNYVKP